MRIGNYLYFSFYRSAFKICQCFRATYCPHIEYKVTQYGDNKLPVEVFDSNFLLLACRLGRAPWETRIASGWRGYVWALKKIGAFRDSAHNGLQSSAGIHVKKYSHMLLYIMLSTHLFASKELRYEKSRNKCSYDSLYENYFF
jgi:hypothetical protein